MSHKPLHQALMCLLAFLCFQLASHSEEIIFADDFEGGWGDWYAENGVWEVGEPTSGPGAAQEGLNVAATNLAGDYPLQTDSRLISPVTTLPSITDEEQLELRFWHWFDYNGGDSYDKGHVQISIWNGDTWTDWATLATPVDAHEGDSSELIYNSPWSKAVANLTAHSGQTVRLAFYHVARQTFSGNGSRSGWYIDEVEIWKGLPHLPALESFEDGWEDWYADHGVWQVGEPTSGPGAAQEGLNVAATTLAGNYPSQTNSRLISPVTTLPSITDEEQLELRFWHWFDYNGGDSYDKGHVQISIWNGDTWTDWATLATPVDAHEGDSSELIYNSPWSKAVANLTAHSGQTVRLVFYHVARQTFSGNGSRSGWYIDEVEIWKGAPHLPPLESFEDGWGDWYADHGVWEVGEPTSGPGEAYQGSNVAATSLTGNYPSQTNSRLVSPVTTLPTITDEEQLELRFWHWFDYNGGDSYDKGHVQISIWDGSTWSDWSTLATPVDAHEGDSSELVYNSPWSKAVANLTAHAGQTVRLAFYHVARQTFSGNGSRSGWYIDEVEIWKGVPQLPALESFEDGWGDWYADHGVWEVGEPTSGPGEAYQGSNVAATTLTGNYPSQTNSRLISPVTTLPSITDEEQLELRFWHWFDYNGGDSYDKGHVQISIWDGSTWSDWTIHDTPVDAHEGDSSELVYNSPWSKAVANLTAHAGQTVRLAFYHVARQTFSGNGSRSGWYIDEVEIWKGVPQLPALESFEDGWGDWYAENGVWQIGIPATAAHQGNLLAATKLIGNYPSQTNSRLISPSFVVPTAEHFPRLRFWHWFEFGGSDYGEVQIRVKGSEDWVALSNRFEDASGIAVWSPSIADLLSYAGQEVELGFFHVAKRTGSRDGEGAGWSIDDVEIIPIPPNEPTYAVFKPLGSSGTSTDGVQLSWVDFYASQFNTSYEVWRGITSDIEAATMIQSGLLQTDFLDVSTNPGKNYYYWARAIRDSEPTPFSKPTKAYRGLQIPEEVEATKGDFKDRILVSWRRTSGAEAYSVYRHDTDDPDRATLLQSGLITTEYLDTDIIVGTNYYYFVKSEGEDNKSDFSKGSLGYAVGDGINTVAATDGLHSDRVDITWEAKEDTTSYTVYSSLNENYSEASIIASGVTEPFFSDISIEPGIVYNYWVRALQSENLTPISNMDSGYAYIAGDSDLVAWGENDYGQTNVPHPELPGKIIEIAGGLGHSLALLEDGTVVGWGRNDYGQAIPPEGLVDVIDIAVGFDHSLALQQDGTVRAWGRNLFGKAEVPELASVIDIEAGADHNLVLFADGTVGVWGGNDFAQANIPEGLEHVVEIAAGGYHNLVRIADGSLVAWGDNGNGQTDIPDDIGNAKKIAAGWFHSLAILDDGTIRGWGDNSKGQLDVPEVPIDNNAPQAKGRYLPRGPSSGAWVDVTGGLGNTTGLTESGEVRVYGDNRSSQTENPDELQSSPATDIANGEGFVMAIKEKTDAAIDSLVPSAEEQNVGDDLVLKVRASGGADLNYQWSWNDIDIPGSTEETLLLEDITAADNGEYIVKAYSKGVEVKSQRVKVEVPGVVAQILGSSMKGIRGSNGNWVFSPVITDPPGLEVQYSYRGSHHLPTMPGPHIVTVEIVDELYVGKRIDMELIVESSNNQPFSGGLKPDSDMFEISYLAPVGFRSILQSSTDLSNWTDLEEVSVGDGEVHSFETNLESGKYFRVAFEIQ